MIITTDDKIVQNTVRNLPTIFEQLRKDNYHQHRPYRPFSDVIRDREWADQPCFIIGGGASLSGFDFERLRGRGRIIAINRAFEFIPFADVLFFMDNRFYQLIHKKTLDPHSLDKWDAFSGYRVFLNIMGRQYDDVYSLRSLGRVGLSNSVTKGIYHGNNSGVGAICLAYCLGTSPIYLLGYDGKFTGGKSHFHSGYNFVMREGVVRSFIKDFERLARFTARISARIINLNPDSAIRCFEFSTIDEVLGNGKTG